MMSAKECLRQLLEVYGWSQNKLAPILGVSQSSLSRIMLGKHARVDYRVVDKMRRMIASKERP